MTSADSLNPFHGLSVAGTDYLTLIRGAGANPEAMERLYQTARRGGSAAAFRGAIAAAHQESPENLLYGAWYYRLHQPDVEGISRRFGGVSTWAVPIGVVLGLALWVVSDLTSF